MVHINMNKPSEYTLTPGVDLWEIAKATVTKSQAGLQMLSLELKRVRKPTDRLWDNLMLEGGGWDIGKQKLGAIVPGDFDGDLDPVQLTNMKLWVSTGIEKYTNKKNEPAERLKVMINDLKHAGFQRAEDVPEGCETPKPKDDTPF